MYAEVDETLEARGRDGRDTLARQAARIWPSPSATDHKGSTVEGQRRGQLSEAAETLWQTATWQSPRVSRGGYTRDGETGEERATLEGQAKLWPTPSASLPNDGENPETWEARRATAQEKHGNNGIGTPLTIAATLWPTPTSHESPSGGYMSGDNRDNWRPSLEGAALGKTPFPSGRPGPETSPPGAASSPSTPASRPRLNPRFVEWLQGWAPGWVDLEPINRERFAEWRAAFRDLLRSVTGKCP